jgi:hypothetical protein
LEPRLCQVKVDHRTDWEALPASCVLNGTVTTAYLNALVRSHHHVGVRRSSDSFVTVIYNAHREHGSHGGFPARLVALKAT